MHKHRGLQYAYMTGDARYEELPDNYGNCRLGVHLQRSHNGLTRIRFLDVPCCESLLCDKVTFLQRDNCF